MSPKVLRLRNSGYFPSDFNQLEKNHLNADYHFETIKEKGSDLIVLTNTETTDKEILDINRNHNLKLIIHPNSGYDNFSVDLFKLIECPFLLGNEIRAKAVSDYIITQMCSYYSIKAQKKWNRFIRKEKTLLEEVNILVFGYGHIAKEVSPKLQSLVKNVDFYDPYIEAKDFDYSLRDYDCIIFACSQNEKNKKIINFDFLSQLKKGSLVINPARGKLIDWDALIDCYSTHFIVDVFPEEPFDFTQYDELENLWMTSHVAGYHKGLINDLLSFEKKIIDDFKSLEQKNFLSKYEDLDLRRKIRDGEFI